MSKYRHIKRTVALMMILALTLVHLSGCAGKTDEPAPETGQTDTAGDTGSDTGDTASDTTSSGAGTDSDKPGSDPQGTDIRFRVVSHYAQTKEKYTPDPEVDYSEDDTPFPWAWVTYPSLEADEETLKSYPALTDAFDELNRHYHDEALSVLSEGASLGAEMAADESWPFHTSNEQTWSVSVARADDNLISMLVVIENYFNGAHPSMTYECINIDPATGEHVSASDVVSSPTGLTDIIMDNLDCYDRDYEFEDSELDNMRATIDDLIASDELVWTADDSGMTVYFDAYTLMFYAFGPITADIPLARYPELIWTTYGSAEKGAGAPLTDRIREETAPESDKETYTAKETEAFYIPKEWELDNGDGIDADFIIQVPDWNEETYVSPTVTYDVEECLINLDEVSKESSDWLNQDEWSAKNNIALPDNLYQDSELYVDGFFFETDNRDEESLKLDVYGTDERLIGHYDFSGFLDTPVAGNEFTNMYIPYAQVCEGVLYTEIEHRTYSADQPYTAYIVAVDLSNGEVLWRSRMLTANAADFLIEDDYIICGYGFTDEDDYMYVLSRYSGRILNTVKLKTGPDHFIRVFEGDNMYFYVLTYNTAYKYEVSFG